MYFLKIVYGLPSRLRRGAKYTPEPQGKRKRSDTAIDEAFDENDTAMRQNPASRRPVSRPVRYYNSLHPRKVFF